MGDVPAYAALGGLIVAALLGYIIGYRRGHTVGYLEATFYVLKQIGRER